jgi:hypothetical protein
MTPKAKVLNKISSAQYSPNFSTVDAAPIEDPGKIIRAILLAINFVLGVMVKRRPVLHYVETSLSNREVSELGARQGL